MGVIRVRGERAFEKMAGYHNSRTVSLCRPHMFYFDNGTGEKKKRKKGDEYFLPIDAYAEEVCDGGGGEKSISYILKHTETKIGAEDLIL